MANDNLGETHQMINIKKYVLVAIMLLMSLGLVSCGSKAGKADPIIATVNGEAIYLSDYQYLANEYLAYFGGSEEASAYLASQKTLLLEELVNNEVLLQKAEQLKIVCSQEEEDEAFEMVELKYGKRETLKMLKASSLTENEYKEMLKNQIILGKLQEVMVAGDIELTDEMLQAYYKEHMEQYTVGAGAQIKEIVISLPEGANKNTIAKVEQAALELENKLASGTDFEVLYDQYHGQNCGLYETKDLGFVQYDAPNVDADLMLAIRRLEEGQVSTAIKTEDGYHFMKAEKIKGEEVKPFGEVRASVEEALIQQEEYAHYIACLKRWVEEAEIITYKERIS